MRHVNSMKDTKQGGGEGKAGLPGTADLSSSVVGLEFLTHPTSKLASQGNNLCS